MGLAHRLHIFNAQIKLHNVLKFMKILNFEFLHEYFYDTVKLPSNIHIGIRNEKLNKASNDTNIFFSKCQTIFNGCNFI